jgi:hypothetical protein
MTFQFSFFWIIICVLLAPLSIYGQNQNTKKTWTDEEVMKKKKWTEKEMKEYLEQSEREDHCIGYRTPKVGLHFPKR